MKKEEIERIERIKKELFEDGFFKLKFPEAYNIALGYTNQMARPSSYNPRMAKDIFND